MESGLEDRNNTAHTSSRLDDLAVSMESGLEDRNNVLGLQQAVEPAEVSMESGLEDRNNPKRSAARGGSWPSLNGVRPRRPEQ